MASASDVCARANIRIEIKNDFKEPMEVDTVEENALSEGEVEDDEPSDVKDAEAAADEPMAQPKNHISYGRNVTGAEEQRGGGGFETGLDIFGEEEQAKRHHRAQRFGLDPLECQAAMSDQQLAELHESLGITADEEAATRFEAIHMYGTRDMSTADVFEYFGKYGPASIEWINDESCNVVWLDRVSAARAFHGLSSPVAGMPVSGKCDPFQGREAAASPASEEPLAHGRSILLVGAAPSQSPPPPQVDADEDKENGAEVLHVSQIDSPVPPGFWRLGVAHPKTRHVLLRFARRTDRKPLRAERFSQYYRKYGNPHYGGIRGLISQSRKLRMRHGGRSTEAAEAAPTDAGPQVVSGDPWGSLAKSWHGDVRERVPEAQRPVGRPGRSILARLGSGAAKRTHHPDDPGGDEDDDAADTEQPDGGTAVKKSKVPRMRMYADEEEARVQKVKQLQKIRQLERIEEIIARTELRAGAPADVPAPDAVPDLRNRIRRQTTAAGAAAQTFRAAMDRAPVTTVKQPASKQPAVPRELNEDEEEDDDEMEDDVNVQQKSKVTVIVKKPSALVKPTVASTIWSRLDREKQLQLEQQQRPPSPKTTGHAHSESDSSSSPEDAAADSGRTQALNQRPGFNRDLKARLGLTSEHKSPLRIEINNDHYKKS